MTRVASLGIENQVLRIVAWLSGMVTISAAGAAGGAVVMLGFALILVALVMRGLIT